MRKRSDARRCAVRRAALLAAIIILGLPLRAEPGSGSEYSIDWDEKVLLTASPDVFRTGEGPCEMKSRGFLLTAAVRAPGLPLELALFDGSGRVNPWRARVTVLRGAGLVEPDLEPVDGRDGWFAVRPGVAPAGEEDAGVWLAHVDFSLERTGEGDAAGGGEAPSVVEFTFYLAVLEEGRVAPLHLFPGVRVRMEKSGDPDPLRIQSEHFAARLVSDSVPLPESSGGWRFPSTGADERSRAAGDSAISPPRPPR